MKVLFSLIAVMLFASAGSAQLCKLAIAMDITPEGSDAKVVQQYSFVCANSGYLGQATNIQFMLPWKIKKVSVSDSKGLLEPAPLDPAFYKLTEKADYSVLSVIPRNSILIGPYGNTYSLSISYSVPAAIESREDSSKVLPEGLLVMPELRMVSEKTSTIFSPDIVSYSVRLVLPEGAELKRSGACKVEESIVSCYGLDQQGMHELELSWRDKSMPEKLMRKGWPWFILSLKSAVGGIFGFLG